MQTEHMKEYYRKYRQSPEEKEKRRIAQRRRNNSEETKAKRSNVQREQRVKYPWTYAAQQAKRRAKEMGLEYTISAEYLKSIWPDKCPILNIPFKSTGDRSSSPSIDRLDNTKGYIPGNVNVISYRANAMKNNATIDELRSLITWMETQLPPVPTEAPSTSPL